ncbi:hypothetical protein [uncultured Megasphaera sp.]|uniref:hypothetical protein n=1 Tax=uncultured Megasphaera sp. TaxID=165188 RepID=UPI0025FFD0C2|nr:hypothetical protein [uncultured Megasphaera sp.]
MSRQNEDRKEQRLKSPLHQTLAADYESTRANIGAHTEKMSKFNARQGHGFAAEQANDLYDKLSGKNAAILGDDNRKNGADRIVDGTLIQTKYCQNAKMSVNSAFGHDGNYRYLDGKGKPMQLEVPKGQFKEAVELLKEKIRDGKVPGCTNPEDAEKLIREGRVTYEQAVKIAKAGNIESLKFDAAHGAVVALSAMGITGTIAFAKAIWSGEKPEVALNQALAAGIQVGGVAFVAEVITAQLTRTQLNNILLKPSIKLVKMLPSNVRHMLVNSMRDGSNIYGNAATKNLAKLLRSNVAAAAVLGLVVTTPQLISMFRGRISKEQLLKNLSITAGGMAGGAGGAVLGSMIVEGVGTVAGGVVGGMAAGKAAHALMSTFIEDDADKMIAIMESELVVLADEYLLSQEEANIVLGDLQSRLTADVLEDMFAADDQRQFAHQMLEKIILSVISMRAAIYIPEYGQIVAGLGDLLEGFEEERDMSYLTNTAEVDTVAMAKRLLNQDVDKRVADKAWYVMKQRNISSMQIEVILNEMKHDEILYKRQKEASDARISAYKKELEELLNGSK